MEKNPLQPPSQNVEEHFPAPISREHAQLIQDELNRDVQSIMMEDQETPEITPVIPTPAPRTSAIKPAPKKSEKRGTCGVRSTIPKPVPNPKINRRPMEAGGPQLALVKVVSPKPIKKKNK